MAKTKINQVKVMSVSNQVWLIFKIPKEVNSILLKFNSWHKVLKFNWAWLAFYAHFFVYGYYGAHSPNFLQFETDILAYAARALMPVLAQITLGWMAYRFEKKFLDSVTIKGGDIFVFLTLALILLVFSAKQLQSALFSDELSYAGSAHGHAIYLSLWAETKNLAFDDYQFKNIVQVISLSLLIVITSFIYISSRLTPLLRITLITVLLIIWRLAFLAKGGNGSPHPPLSLMPSFLFGSIFGINNTIFKLSHFIPYIILLSFVNKMTKRIFPWRLAYISTLAIGTTPLFLNLSTVVEHSFWALFCFSIIFVELITSSCINYVRLIGFVSIMTMMRQPSFIVLIPILFLQIFESCQFKISKEKIKDLLSTLLILLVFLPFLFTSLLNGTPSTSPLEQSTNFANVTLAIKSGIFWNSLKVAFSPWLLLLILFAFIPLKLKSFKLNIFFLIFFGLSTFIYYSISPGLWGLSKYQAEFAGPLIIAGHLLLIKTNVERNYSQFTILSLPLLLIFINTINYIDMNNQQNINKIFPSSELDAGNDFSMLSKGIVAIPYDYQSAYKFIKENELSLNTYSIGATYGILPEIINGYTVREVGAAYKIYLDQKFKRRGDDGPEKYADSINGDLKIKAVIIGSYPQKKELAAAMTEKGWSKMAEFKHPQYGTTVLVLLR